jgi:hypothetical protein
MCLIIYNPETTFLKYKDKLIAYKRFDYIYIDNKIRLIPPYANCFYNYNIAIVGELLKAFPENKNQEVGLRYNIKEKDGWIKETLRRTFLNLGFHIFLFDFESSLDECFRLFKVGRNFVDLPIFVDLIDIQLLGDDVIVETFEIPSKEIYLDLCAYYDIKKPNFELQNFLENLYKSYYKLKI